MGASRRMDALICDSLQYTKVVGEKIPLALLDPGAVLRGILESYPNLQGPNLKIQIVEPLPPVVANEAGLTQCFANLLNNALKFVKPGVTPKVRVRAETRNDFVRFWFEDEGIGIPAKYHERIFGMFQQLNKSYEGTGMGLALEGVARPMPLLLLLSASAFPFAGPRLLLFGVRVLLTSSPTTWINSRPAQLPIPITHH